MGDLPSSGMRTIRERPRGTRRPQGGRGHPPGTMGIGLRWVLLAVPVRGHPSDDVEPGPHQPAAEPLPQQDGVIHACSIVRGAAVGCPAGPEQVTPALPREQGPLSGTAVVVHAGPTPRRTQAVSSGASNWASAFHPPVPPAATSTVVSAVARTVALAFVKNTVTR
jgi:hypothetical protein